MESLRGLFYSLSRWSAIALAALLPIFFIPGGFVTVPQGKLVLVSILAGVSVLFLFLASIIEGVFRFPRNGLFFAAALLPLAYIASTAIAGYPTSSVVSGLAEQDTVTVAALWFAVFATTALTVARDGSLAITLLRSLVAGIAALLVLHIARLFFPAALSFGGVFPNEINTAAGSWHDLGISLGAAVVLCGALFKTRVAGGRIWRFVFATTAVLAFFFLIIVSMQDIWFVLAAVCGMFGIYAYFAAGPAQKEMVQAAPGHWVQSTTSSAGASSGVRIARSAFWIVVALLAFLLGWFNTAIHERLPEPFSVLAVEVRPSWEGTLSVGQNSLSDSRALFFGTGPNSFARNWAQHKPEGVNTTLFWNLDFSSGVGVVPTSLVTIGIVGVLAWALLVLAFLWAAGKALSATRLFDATQMTVFGIVCAIVFLFAFHVMYAPGVAISTMLFLLLGIFVSLPLGEAQYSFALPIGFGSIRRFLAFIGVAAVSLALVLASSTSLQALTSDVLVNRSIISFSQSGDVQISKELIERAVHTWSKNDRAHRAAVEIGILELAQLAKSAAADPAATAQLQKKLTETIDHGLAAIAIDRVDYQNWLTLAFLYQELAGAGVEGAYEQSQAAYTAARNENPTNPLPLLRLAQLQVARGDGAGALQNLDAALALKPDFAPAHFMRSQLLAQQQKLQDAVQSAAAAVQLVPQDPLGWYNLGTILYAGGSYGEAGAAFVQAVTLRGDYSDAIFMLALAHYQLGQRDQAVAALMRVLELNPGNETVSSMIKNLSAGKDPFDGMNAAQ